MVVWLHFHYGNYAKIFPLNGEPWKLNRPVGVVLDFDLADNQNIDAKRQA